MAKEIFATGKNVNSEGGAVLKFFRILSDEEQRIVYAILEGMRLQKDLDFQIREKPYCESATPVRSLGEGR